MAFPKGQRNPNGGRKKGVPNKKTAEDIARVAASGLMPVDYMLQVMRDNTAEKSRRDDMAKAVAPYLSPKLANIEVGNKDNKPFVIQVSSSDEKLL